MNAVSELVTPADTAKLLMVTEGTLSVWRCVKRYPLKYVRVGRRIRYRRSDIEAFLQARTMSGDGSGATKRGRRKAA